MERGHEPQDEVFQIPARRCRRCGGLLTSKAGIRDGYGPCCLRKLQEEEAERQARKAQFSLFEEEEKDHETADEAPGADDGRTV